MNSDQVPQLLLALALLCGGCKPGSATQSAPHTQITVPIDGAVDEAVGINLSAGAGPTDRTAIEDPALVTVMLPSGLSWSSQSKVTFVSQVHGFVSQVDVTPLDEAASFRETTKRLRTIVDKLGFKPDAQVYDKIAKWDRTPPNWDPFSHESLSCEIEPGVELFVEIKPANEAEKWFLVCSFYASRFFK